MKLDEKTLELVMESVRADLLRSVRSCIKDEHESEDIVQDTMLKLWEHNSNLREPTLTNWLKRVANNTMIDHIRRDGRECTGDLVDHSARDVCDVISHQEDMMHVYVVLNKLPSLYSTALKLKYMEECSYKEMSAMLHVDEVYIPALLKLAKAEFRKAYNYVPTGYE